MKKTILITGSSGQIGTNLIQKLVKDGLHYIGLDIRENTWDDSIPTRLIDLTKGVSEEVLPADTQIDLVVHFAAHAKVHQSVVDPSKALEIISMTFHALEISRKFKVPFILASSREVYGEQARETFREEDISMEAESPYTASKISSEAMVRAYSKCYDINHIIFRFSNVYGRFDDDIDRLERVIPLFIKKISQGEEITVYGPEKSLDFTFVDDCVGGIYLGITKLLSGEIETGTFNLSYGEARTLGRLVELIAENLEIEAKVTIEPVRVGEISHYVANLENSRSVLGYDPQTPLEEGLRRMISRSHKAVLSDAIK